MHQRKLAVILRAPQGGGKGRATKGLQNLGFSCFGTGEIIRARRRNEPEFEEEWGKWIDDGHLLPDDVMLPMIRDARDVFTGDYAFDGFPRTLAQTEFLVPLLEELDYSTYSVIFEHLTFEECWRRVQESHKPGGANDRGDRADDRNEHSFRRRFEHHIAHSGPIDSYLEARTTCIRVDGRSRPEAIIEAIETSLFDCCSR